MEDSKAKLEKEKGDKYKGLEWEQVQRGLSAPKIGDVEHFIVQNLKLIPAFDEHN